MAAAAATAIFLCNPAQTAQSTVLGGEDVSGQVVDQRAEIAAFTSRFIQAFENLDMPAFIECFAEDATVFFPAPEPAERHDGRRAIKQHFEQIFEVIRKEAVSGPPFHRILPEETSVQFLGEQAAAVTFHLRYSGALARRTLVLRKSETGWLIAHLHASI